MPELLRRMYTQIALGVFGPGWDGFTNRVARTLAEWLWN
jgi:hypothetical protein